MKNNLWKILIATGTMLIFAALFLCLYNYRQSAASYRSAQDVLSRLQDAMQQITAAAPDETQPASPVAPQDDLFAPYEPTDAETEPVTVTIDGNAYIGCLTIPSLGIELPVMADWSYDKLKTAPCRYSGAAETNDLILCAHNYVSHFGPIRRLSAGERIVFTACDGTEYSYEVAYTEEIGGYQIEQMLRGGSEEWDLTLFTCTLGGQSRVTVRANRAAN